LSAESPVAVTAYNNNGESSQSGATVSVGDDDAPNTPTRPSVSRIKHGGIATITWTAPAGPLLRVTTQTTTRTLLGR
jgi:hypothetical protein